jgi:predicted alpha/beta superfamily hydrolase
MKSQNKPPTFTLASRETGTTYHIYVEKTRGARRRVPVVLFLDGDNQFAAAVKAYRQLRAVKKIPALLLVGVGYGASYGQPANRRGRDYTPTFHRFEPQSGKADAFLRFLTRTLMRELGRRYSIDTKQRGIAGHSLGSLLVLHALWRQPLAFTHHLASAPSIWWDNRSILRLAAKRRKRSARLRTRLFLSVGGKDSVSMRDDLGRLLRQLAEKPFSGLDVSYAGFPEHNHYDVLETAFAAGLEALFSGRSVARP